MGRATPDADEQTVRALQAGDPAALTRLMERYGRWVRSVAMAAVGDPDRVEDVCQQTWASVWEQAGQLRDPGRWKAWLFRLARNAAHDAGRGRMRQERRLEAAREAAARVQAPPEPGEAAAADEVRQIVLRAVQGLPEHYREPLVLRYLEGLSYRQIAELLGMPVDTVETRLVRARRLLRETLRGVV